MNERALNKLLSDELEKTNLFLIHVVSNLPLPNKSDSPIRDLLEGHISLNRTALDWAKRDLSPDLARPAAAVREQKTSLGGATKETKNEKD